MKRLLSMVLAVIMCVSMLPVSAFAANDFNINGSSKNDGYYNLISKQDWDIAPGITESEIVLNNDSGTKRQVLHVMEADMNNEYTKVIASYAEMNTSKYQVATMDKQAQWVEENWEYNVVGAMNTCLSWYTGYPADQVGKPLGFMMVDGTVLWEQCDGFPTVLVINKDQNENGESRPESIPKVEMVQIRSTEDLDGWEEQVIPCSSGYIVKDGVNQYSPVHNDEAPRSVVGIKADGTIVIMENDGRQSPFSAGMCMYELAEVMIGLGCTYAVNCDGGGTSTYLSQRPGEELTVNNSPSDGALRPTTQGILFITTAPSTGEFVRASISVTDEYYTPESTVQFTAVGADLAGAAAEIPADAYWKLADSSFGTIDSNGLFVSNGKTGVVTAQIVYNEQVVGECSVNIVIPQTFVFKQSNITIPYGKSVALYVVAKYGQNEVVLKDGDVTFALSDNSLGTLNGNTLIATSDTNITGGSISATLNYGTGIDAVANVTFGRGSKVVYDFESGSDSIANIHYAYKGTIYPDTYTFKDTLSVVSAADGGQVRNGNYALKITSVDNSITMMGWCRTEFKGWNIDLKDATSVSFWLYVPEGSHGREIDVENVVPINLGHEYKYGTGWQYITIDVEDFNVTTLNNIIMYHSDNDNDSCNYKHQEHPNYYQDVVFYMDDITVNYSTALEDFEPPVISDVLLKHNSTNSGVVMNGQKINENLINITAKVADANDKNNYSGINPESLVVYADGVKIDATCSKDGVISTEELELANGMHKFRIEMSDNNGNTSYVENQIEIAVENNTLNTIKYAPADSSLINLPVDSVYWMNLTATAIEEVEEVSVTLALDTNNTWCLEHMILAEGFEASYTIDADNNDATIVFTRSDDISHNEISDSGEMVLAKLPIRVWKVNYNIENEDAKCYRLVAVETDVRKGLLTEKDANKLLFSSQDYSIVTEFNGTRTITGVIGSWHSHTSKAVDDVTATCTVDGYSGRTYCSVCNSVDQWGTMTYAKGHSWKVNADGKLACENGGELFSGTDNDGRKYVEGVVIADGWEEVNGTKTYYYVDGFKLVGSHLIDGTMCTFDALGVYQSTYKYDGWYETNNTIMYFISNEYLTGFQKLQGKSYYFDDNGMAYEGTYSINGKNCVFDNGVFVSCEDTTVVEAGWCGEDLKSVEYVLYDDGRIVISGSGRMMNFVEVSTVPWSSYSKTFIKEVYIGKEITKIGNHAFRNCFEATKLTFEENSKLTYIGMRAFHNMRHLKSVVLPETVEVLRWNAFGYAYNLTSIYMPGSLTTIEKGAFEAHNAKLVMDVEEDSAAETFAKDNKIDYTVRTHMVKDGIVEEAGTLYYYVNDVKTNAGLVKVGEHYYYTTSGGRVVTGNYWVSRTNDLLPAGYYFFDATTGQMDIKNGIVEEDGALYYYVNGSRTNAGLVKVGEHYYYTTSGGRVVTGKYWVNRTNELLPAGYYFFDETTGQMDIKNGIVEEDGALYYYVNGTRTSAGLVKVEEHYYYISSGGKAVTGKYWVSRTNELLPAGYYFFNEATGQMDIKNGIVEEDGALYYYTNGVRANVGLVKIDEDYYYASSGGKVVTGKYWVGRTNDLLPAGYYNFDSESGKMIQQ